MTNKNVIITSFMLIAAGVFLFLVAAGIIATVRASSSTSVIDYTSPRRYGYSFLLVFIVIYLVLFSMRKYHVKSEAEDDDEVEEDIKKE